ncbi:MAG: DUF4129 domain-containing protein [Anaerolineae bacterium]
MPGTNLRHSRWLETLAIPAASAVMRVAWMSPVIHLALNNPFTFPTGLIVPAWWLLALLLVPVALQRLRLPPRWSVALYASLGLAAIPLTWAIVFGLDGTTAYAWIAANLRAITDWRLGIPNPLVLAVSTVIVWQRGVTGNSMRYDGLWASFVWGSIALGTLMLFRIDTLESIEGVNIVASLVVFVLFGLVGLALLALSGTLTTENLRSRARLGISRSWLVVVGSSAAAVLVLGWAAGLVLAPETMGRILVYLKPVWDLLLLVILGIATLIAYAVLWLIRPILQSAYDRIMPILQRNDLGELRRYLFEDLRIGEREPLASNQLWQLAWRPLFITALVGLALWLIVRAWRRRVRTDERGVVETRESILTPGLLRAQLAGLVRRTRPPATFLALDPEHSAREAVRAAYQTLLAGAREAGAPRSREVTPERYERELVMRWPDHASAFRALTRSYVLARYGLDEVTRSDVASAWQALQQLPFPVQQNGGTGNGRLRRPAG